MGEINKAKIKHIIKNCKTVLVEYINKAELTDADYIYILIILSQYLYARYAEYGILNDNIYTIYPNDVYNGLCDTRYAEYARSIIILRNLICHDYGSKSCISKLNTFKNDTETLNDFLKFLFPVSSFDSAINKMSK